MNLIQSLCNSGACLLAFVVTSVAAPVFAETVMPRPVPRPVPQPPAIQVEIKKLPRASEATFPISFWCGPPDDFITLARFQEIKEAGFTHVMPPCGGRADVERNRKILDVCQSVGLKAFLTDARMPFTLSGSGGASATLNAKRQIDAIVNDYKTHPALAGYSLTDEPGAGAFAGLGEVVAYLRDKDPEHPAYINLLPNYANLQQLGISSYEAYLRAFIQQVKPSVLSYDHYHFLKGGDRPGFFSNLAAARATGAQFGIPFWQIVLVTEHGPYRHLGEGELRYEAMQTLAYGGKGLMWFTYWEPRDASFKWSHALINLDGTRDPHYEMVQRINAETTALGTQLLQATSTAVFHEGRLPPGGIKAPENTATMPLRSVGRGDFTIGLFHKPIVDTDQQNTTRILARANGTARRTPDKEHKDYTLALITNADYSESITGEFLFSMSANRLQRFNQWTGQWQAVSNDIGETNNVSLPLHLVAGGAALFRWRT